VSHEKTKKRLAIERDYIDCIMATFSVIVVLIMATLTQAVTASVTASKITSLDEQILWKMG